LGGHACFKQVPPAFDHDLIAAWALKAYLLLRAPTANF
jgi:hypothetical protein